MALHVGVPSTVTLTVRERLKKKNATAMTTIRTPNASATQGQRFDGSPGSTGSTTGGRTLILNLLPRQIPGQPPCRPSSATYPSGSTGGRSPEPTLHPSPRRPAPAQTPG